MPEHEDPLLESAQPLPVAQAQPGFTLPVVPVSAPSLPTALSVPAPPGMQQRAPQRGCKATATRRRLIALIAILAISLVAAIVIYATRDRSCNRRSAATEFACAQGQPFTLKPGLRVEAACVLQFAESGCVWGAGCFGDQKCVAKPGRNSSVEFARNPRVPNQCIYHTEQLSKLKTTSTLDMPVTLGTCDSKCVNTVKSVIRVCGTEGPIYYIDKGFTLSIEATIQGADVKAEDCPPGWEWHTFYGVAMCTQTAGGIEVPDGWHRDL